jgi:hypothetical protein
MVILVSVPGFARTQQQITSLEELLHYAGKSDVEVTMRPGVYEIAADQPLIRVKVEYQQEDGSVFSRRTTNAILHFSGKNSVYHLYGVILRIDTAVHLASHDSLDKVLVTGAGNTIHGLEIIDQGDHATRGAGVRMVHISGDGNTLDQVGLWSRGSSPYGYGNLLGKSASSLVPLHKQSTLLVTGKDTQLQRVRIVTRTFGHGLVLQGAVNTLIDDCSVEGEMRTTDDILREPAGLAKAVDFRSDYPPGRIVPGQMIALSEDGVRAYPDGTGWNTRRTRDLVVRRTTVRNMRSGFDLSIMTGQVTLTECLALGCSEKGYALPSGAVVARSAGDTLYAPLLSMPDRDLANCRVELEWLPESSAYAPTRFAEINGRGHHLVFTVRGSARDATPLPIVFGESYWADVNVFRRPTIDPRTGASEITLENHTPMPVVLRRVAVKNTVKSIGPLLSDEGADNRFESLTAQ